MSWAFYDSLVWPAVKCVKERALQTRTGVCLRFLDLFGAQTAELRAFVSYMSASCTPLLPKCSATAQDHWTLDAVQPPLKLLLVTAVTFTVSSLIKQPMQFCLCVASCTWSWLTCVWMGAHNHLWGSGACYILLHLLINYWTGEQFTFLAGMSCVQVLAMLCAMTFGVRYELGVLKCRLNFETVKQFPIGQTVLSCATFSWTAGSSCQINTWNTGEHSRSRLQQSADQAFRKPAIKNLSLPSETSLHVSDSLDKDHVIKMTVRQHHGIVLAEHSATRSKEQSGNAEAPTFNEL